MATSSILDALTRGLGPSAFSKAAETFGETGPGITKAFTTAVGSVLAPLVARSGEPQFMRNMLSAVREVPSDVTLLDDPTRLFSRTPRATEEAGPVAMLRSVVTGGDSQMITDGITKASGVKPATAATLFSIALPTVLGYLSRLVARENLDADGLGRRLAAERPSLAAVLPDRKRRGRRWQRPARRGSMPCTGRAPPTRRRSSRSSAPAPTWRGAPLRESRRPASPRALAHDR